MDRHFYLVGTSISLDFQMMADKWVSFKLALTVRATVDEFFKANPGADNVRTEIYQFAATLPGFEEARDGASAAIAGRCVSQTNTVHLVCSSFRTENDVVKALW